MCLLTFEFLSGFRIHYDRTTKSAYLSLFSLVDFLLSSQVVFIFSFCFHKLTIIHQVGHSKDQNHRRQTHQNHRTLQETQNTKSTSFLIILLLRSRSHFNPQLIPPCTKRLTLIVPFISSKCRPCADILRATLSSCIRCDVYA